jgi:hypothetical protein
MLGDNDCAELRLGIARDGGRLDAHAWLESEGRVVIGNAELWRYAAVVVSRVARTFRSAIFYYGHPDCGRPFTTRSAFC